MHQKCMNSPSYLKKANIKKYSILEDQIHLKNNYCKKYIRNIKCFLEKPQIACENLKKRKETKNCIYRKKIRNNFRIMNLKK